MTSDMRPTESTQHPTVAVFRPDDDRLADAVSLLERLGATPVPDPMLAIDPTNARPRSDASYVIFTSRTGSDLLPADWHCDGQIVAIGPSTASALRTAGYAVDLVPAQYSSEGLVTALANQVAGDRVEIARSDHGSPRLIEGLIDAGAYVHETVLYRLARPSNAGRSVELAAAGDLDYALFTSSLTVEHFLEAATERGLRDAVQNALSDTVTVGAIGEPTRQTAHDHDIPVDVVPEQTTFEALARAALAD